MQTTHNHERESLSKEKSALIGKPRFWHDEQEIAWRIIEENQVVFLTGPAGTAKTFLASMFAIGELCKGHIDNIYVSRPAVEAVENLGFLPGTSDDKLKPYLAPIFDVIERYQLPETKKQAVKIRPLAYMRGITFTNSVAILDEAQNATDKQLKMFLTRLGKNSKLIICGDTDQCDLRVPECLSDFAKRLSVIRGVGWYDFSDAAIVRHPLVGKILQGLKQNAH